MIAPTKSHNSILVATAAVCCLLAAVAIQETQASQGCPFDDGSCQEYCGQQGCNMGYCGHFAWIQCICRKCGDEWSWYDKVHYNPDKTVNQTELDSLKLNSTNPLILTNSQNTTAPTTLVATLSSTAASASTTEVRSQVNSSSEAANNSGQQQQRATLTTLLIPDLSDSSKLDLNDIPDENSDKFLDYLAKNHERLVQATSSKDSSARQQASKQDGGDDEDSTSGDDESVEIQISSSSSSSNENNNSASQQQQASQQQTTEPTTSSSTTTTTTVPPSTTTTITPLEPGSSHQQRSPLIRLIHMATDEQLFDTSEQ